MAQERGQVKLVHITTVPESLFFLAGQPKWMASRGFDVHAISSPGEMLGRFAAQEKVPVYPVAMERGMSPVRDLIALGQIVRTLRKIRPHIVHSHTPKAGMLGTIAAKLAGVPVAIYHVHGLPLMTATGGKRKILQSTERISCRAADQTYCVSRSVMGVMIAERLCPKGKVKVLLGGSINGVDAQQRFNPDLVDFQRRIEICRALGIPESALVIGFVGRIVVDKGVVELVKACESLLDDYPSFHLLMVGPFESRDSVPPSIENILRTHPNIHCTGMDWNTPPLYSAMDVVVLPSYREGFPSVPLEAGAMRLPVVATTVPGCVDAVIDGVTGILVPPRDCEALADAVKKYLNSPDLRLRHGRAGRERVLREFGQEDIWKAIHAEYQRLLSVGES